MITRTTSRWTYQPDGATTSFPFDNLLLAAAHLQVTWYDQNGTVMALPGYNVTGVGNPNGGAVVFNTAPAATAGSLLVIERVSAAVTTGADPIDFMQDTAATRQFYRDLGLALDQERANRLKRTLQLSPLDPDGPAILPPAAQRANQALLFGPDGSLTAGAPLVPGAMVVSAFMQGMLAAIDAPAALGTLGFSAFVKGIVGSASAAAFVAAIGAASAAQAAAAPQGRLTALTLNPVMTGNTVGATKVYYTPYIGQLVPLWTGASFAPTIFAELSNDLTQAAAGNAGPAAVVANSNYDLFVWLNGVVPTLSRGPAWASDSLRGAGAGTTQIARVQGLLVNSFAIANGPAAGAGLYVGTIRTNAAAQVDWKPEPATAIGGGSPVLGIFNAFNRIRFTATNLESTVSWVYGGSVWRPSNNSAGNRISYIDGLAEVAPAAAFHQPLNGQSANNAAIGINLNSIAASPKAATQLSGTTYSFTSTQSIRVGFQPLLGFNYLQAMEYGGGASTPIFYGGAVNAVNQASSLMAELHL